MTQQELADMLHVTNKAVSKWECGRSLPDLAMLEPLARALEVSVEELLAGKRLPAAVSEGNESIPMIPVRQAKLWARTEALRAQEWAVENAKKLWIGALLLWAGWLVLAVQIVESVRDQYFDFIGVELVNSLSAEDWARVWEANGGRYWRTVFPGVAFLRWEGRTAWRLTFLWGYFRCRPWMFVLFLAAVAAVIAGIVLRRKAGTEKFDFSVDNS